MLDENSTAIPLLRVWEKIKIMSTVWESLWKGRALEKH